MEEGQDIIITEANITNITIMGNIIIITMATIITFITIMGGIIITSTTIIITFISTMVIITIISITAYITFTSLMAFIITTSIKEDIIEHVRLYLDIGKWCATKDHFGVGVLAIGPAIKVNGIKAFVNISNLFRRRSRGS